MFDTLCRGFLISVLMKRSALPLVAACTVWSYGEGRATRGSPSILAVVCHDLINGDAHFLTWSPAALRFHPSRPAAPRRRPAQWSLHPFPSGAHCSIARDSMARRSNLASFLMSRCSRSPGVARSKRRILGSEILELAHAVAI